MDLNEYEYQANHPALSMDRSSSSHSSMGSINSEYSSRSGQEQLFTNPLSPGSSYTGSPRSPPNEYTSPLKPPYTTKPPSYVLLTQQEPEVKASSSCEREPNIRFPLFDIESFGNPNIKWYMYYDFKVTKTEAYFELQPGYLVTENYPSRVPSAKYEDEHGVKRHPCRFFACTAKPFSRHYDLERHFRTIHSKDVSTAKEVVYCDYNKCPHKAPLRKDHGREHYREYHNEDLMKRPKKGEPEKAEECNKWWDNRNIDTKWWRCSQCLQRVKVAEHEYQCRACNKACEHERVMARKELSKQQASPQERGSSSTMSMATANYLSLCGRCENAWVPDATGDNWLPCPRCQLSDDMILSGSSQGFIGY